MSQTRTLILAAGCLAVAAFVALSTGGTQAHAKGKEVHLRYAATYAEAVQEARARNAFIFATFHKDK